MFVCVCGCVWTERKVGVVGVISVGLLVLCWGWLGLVGVPVPVPVSVPVPVPVP